MNKLPSNYNLSTQKNPLSHSLLFTLLVLVFTATACSSTCKKESLLMHVLDEQNSVLRKLRAERQEPAVVNKVRSDRVLSESESHLNQAFQSLLESNETVKASL